MSRFLNSTRRVELGACQCPGAPHADGDWVDMRAATPWGALMDAGAADTPSLAYLALAVGTISGWNLVDEDGAGVPVTRDSVAALDGTTFTALIEDINQAAVTGNALPNASGAPSRPSRRGSATSRTPKGT